MMCTRHAALDLAVGCVAIAALAVVAAGALDLDWRTIDGGGGTSAGGRFRLAGTVGQADAGVGLRARDLEIIGGFWAAAGSPPPACPGDVDRNDVVDVRDLIAVLAAWGLCEGCPEDVDGTGTVDVADLLVVLAHWGACP